jgi:hypothetical protein
MAFCKRPGRWENEKWGLAERSPTKMVSSREFYPIFWSTAHVSLCCIFEKPFSSAIAGLVFKGGVRKSLQAHADISKLSPEAGGALSGNYTEKQ